MTKQDVPQVDGSAQAVAPVTEKKPKGLALLRAPFPANQISKLPKPTKAQNEAVKKDFTAGIRCAICGGWHHPKVVHLDYVGHAALTDRLLDCDESWDWEPVATSDDGTPKIDNNNGMWIRLTVCGQTRLGYGHADGKSGGDAVKEVIGDALRNAAMRFGAALDLWHKGDLHGIDDNDKPDTPRQEPFDAPGIRDRIKTAISNRDDVQALDGLWKHPLTVENFGKLPPPMQAELQKAYTDRMAVVCQVSEITDDEIPY